MLQNFFPVRLSQACMVIVIFLFLAKLSSCKSDDDEIKDTTNPVVSFSSLANNAVVWSTVSETLNATDNQGIQMLEFYVDGNLVSTLTQAPYTVNWDSNTVPDGPHNIKIVATDKAGNKSESQITVTVKNTLITIEVDENQLESSEYFQVRQFVFLSDDEGKVIASAEVENGKTITLKAPQFNGSKFYLSQASYEIGTWDEEEEPYLFILTFPQVERGKWALTPYTSGERTYVGAASLSFTNASLDHSYRIVGNGDAIDHASSEEGSITGFLGLIKSPSKLYVTKRPLEGGPPENYLLLPSISTGTNAPINLNQVNQPLTTVQVNVPAGTIYSGSRLYGFTVAGDYSEEYELASLHYDNSPEDLTLKIHHPGNAFPSYYQEYYFESENEYHTFAKRSTQLDLTPITYQRTATTSNRTITYSATGTFDLAYSGFRKAGKFTRWTIIHPAGTNATVMAPELPAEIKALADQQIFDFPEGPRSYGFMDYPDVTDYAGFITAIQNSPLGVNTLYALGKEYRELEVFPGEDSGGRKAALTKSEKNFKKGFLTHTRKK